MNDFKWIECATQFTIALDMGLFQIQKVEQVRGDFLWKVYKNGFVLSKELEMEYEPMPSSRTDEFIDLTRFATKEEAYESLEKYQKKMHREVIENCYQKSLEYANSANYLWDNAIPSIAKDTYKKAIEMCPKGYTLPPFAGNLDRKEVEV